ncbi:hypothetical protein [Azospirillum griseum]|uniref:Uncharacterized protein n=1 Tax=Azospirillum griseum TaxID=2496639 RepID=A0A3S0K5S1_9PROT|nr:hypothetical protein [Azospirillum griseum]RTR21398.1 hypothetical protein EJ903_08265 [Azospirillum griseum]
MPSPPPATMNRRFFVGAVSRLPTGRTATPPRGPSRSVSSAAIQRKQAFAVGDVDDTIARSMATILSAKVGAPLALGASAPRLETAAGTPLSALADGETLYLDAHGAAPEEAGVPGAAVLFGGLSPEQLATLVLSKGLQATYAGKIYLNGCNTATGAGADTYAFRFQAALALRGVRCIVKGNGGYSQVDGATGHTLVNPPTPVGAQNRTALQDTYRHAGTLKAQVERDMKYVKDNPLAPDFSAKVAAIKQANTDMRTALSTVPGLRAATYLPDKALRPTLPAPVGITHYESANGRYSAVPASVGRSGRTLEQHVQAALASYNSKWKFNPSAASTAAVGVLGGPFASHTARLMAVRWYLRLGPRPPVQLVAVGDQLSAGSSLYGFLKAEYDRWV